MKKELSIILPTLNEYKNLKILVPELEKILVEEKFDNYEIIIVDDGSIDNTVNLINSLNKTNPNIKIFSRSSEPSLPLSIWEGIDRAIFQNVMWLDADGSMHNRAVKELIINYFTNQKVVIGSRFVEGGGYKGVTELNNKSFLKAAFNVSKSEDSVMGMIVSIMFNKLLNLILKSEVKDLTSGFIILKKNYLSKSLFEESNYGEYFLNIVTYLMKSNIPIKEIGYICETRKYGKSKTASTIFQLISRGIPYLTTAYKCRVELKL